MNIASWCLQNRVTTLVATTFIILGGIFSFQSLPKAENPDFTIRTALVITAFPGATSLKVESLVTDPIEEKIRELPHIDEVTSQSLPGLSIVTIDLFESTPKSEILPTWANLRNKIDELTPTLPAGVLAPKVNDEFGDVFGMLVALTGDGHTVDELGETADRIRDELLKVEGVSKVEIYGKQDERIFVEVSNSLFAERGLSPFLLSNAIARENVVKPSGEARVGSERVLIQSTGEFNSVEDIENVSLRLPGSDTAIVLRDIASVERSTLDPPRELTRHNGTDAIVIAINMAQGFDILKVGKVVGERLGELQDALPIGYDLNVVTWESTYVDRKITDFVGNLVQAFVFVFIVMLLTTGLRAGLIASSLIPIAILMCFGLMPVFGVTLQQISIASLIIALGIMVDNGVVVSENILVRLNRGDSRDKAVKGAIAELWKPLLAASLTTIWAFLPIGTAKSNVGEFCLSLFQVITITLLCSWLISLTLVPLLCHQFLKPKIEEQTYDSPLYRTYRNILLGSLRYRFIFLLGTFLVTFVGVFAFGYVKQIFFPPNEREVFLADVWAPYGSDVRTTAAEAERLEKWLLAQEEVAKVTTFVGNGGPRWSLSQSIEQSNAAYAFMLIELAGGKDGIPLVGEVFERAQQFADMEMPHSRITFRLLEQGPPVGAPIQIRILGEDIPTLYALRDQIGQILAETPGTLNIYDSWGEWRKMLTIDVNQEQVKRAGLTSEDVALSLQLHMSGLQASDYREGDEVIPIVIRSTDEFREDMGKVESLNVFSTSSSRNVPLAQVASTKVEYMPPNIQRKNGKRTMTLSSYLNPGFFASDTLKAIEPKIAELFADPLYDDYEFEFGGEAEGSATAQASIAAEFPFAMGLLFLTLCYMFNSVARPAIILITILPSIFGIAIGLLASNASFGFMAMLGGLSLMGIIVNNAIMLIDTTESIRGKGVDAANAVVVAGLSRLRPILTTASTTIIGLMPLWFFGGEMWRPMAIVIVCGLAFSTVLTLILCPVLYSVFLNVKFKGYRWDKSVLAKVQD